MGPHDGFIRPPYAPKMQQAIDSGLDDRPTGSVNPPSYRIRNEAVEYKKRMGINKPAPEKYQKLDEGFSRQIAQAYEQMEHNPNDPEVAAAYNALVVESTEQYKDIIANGLNVEFIPSGQSSPYEIPTKAVEDIVINRHMWVYSTRDGHGQGEELSGNPLLAPTEFQISGQTALANDIFRVVHDYFGHAKDGIGFRAEGEENAFLSHSAMYSNLAQKALATETRGQNSWVNFGPRGSDNRTASEEATVFAEQKVGLLPEKFSNPNNPYSTAKNAIEETIAGMKDGSIMGETFNMNGSRYTGGGIAVAVISENFDTQKLTPEMVNKQIQKFMKNHRTNEKIGVFTLEETNGETSSIDLALIIPQEQRDLAIRLGTYTEQQSLWDFDNNELIRLSNTGFANKNLTMTQLRAVQNTLTKGFLPSFIVNTEKPKDLFDAQFLWSEKQGRMKPIKKKELKPPEQSTASIIKPSDIRRITYIQIGSGGRGYSNAPHIYQYKNYIIRTFGGKDWQVRKDAEIVRKKYSERYTEVEAYGGKLMYPDPWNRSHPTNLSLAQAKEWLVNHVNQSETK